MPAIADAPTVVGLGMATLFQGGSVGLADLAPAHFQNRKIFRGKRFVGAPARFSSFDLMGHGNGPPLSK
ncbi:MAG: hypothetical protein ABI218_03070 [Caldimonas sp.]